MQEKWQQMKIPPAWKPDEWVCNHSSSRQSTRLDNYSNYPSGRKSAATPSRYVDSPISSKRISTAKLRQQIEDLNLKSAERRRSGRQSRTKRLDNSHSPRSYKSIFSYVSHRPITPIHIPKMSKQSLKRWLDARDAYLGHNYPYIQERFERHRRRRRRKTKSGNEENKIIDYESAVSICSMESDRFSVPELISTGQQRRLSRRESRTKQISQSETNLKRKRGLFERIKEFVQAPVRSLSRLSLRKRQSPRRVQIIHDNFDDKCIGTETSERKILRTNIERKDQSTQVNIPRPQIKLHHEFDTSMVVGEKKQRIRSVRRDVDYLDKATETDFILNFAIIEKERKGKEKVDNDEDDKAIRRRTEKEKIDPYQEQYNVEQEQHRSPSMLNSGQRKKRQIESQQIQNLTNTGNRIVPLTDLIQSSTTDKQNGSRSTILTSTDSTASTHEQLLRYVKQLHH